ncbi:MAG: sigma-70 family RNA polymerase sigma factor [Bacteroidota bacterium]
MKEEISELEQERIWVAQSKKNSDQFRPLYEKYYGALYRFFVRRTDDEALSQDLCSQTFFHVLDTLHQFEWQGKPFGAWLFKIGANILRKHFRQKQPIYLIEVDHLHCMEDLPTLQESDHLEKLIPVLDQLDEMELRLLELKYFEKCSFKEISTLLGIGESAVKMRLYRLLSRLKTFLEQK